MTTVLADYLLAVYVVAGLIVAALLGCGIGSCGRAWEVSRATRRVCAERDDALEQWALAEKALDAATHPITSTDDRTETDFEALVRVVMATPPVDPEAWVWDTTPVPGREVSE